MSNKNARKNSPCVAQSSMRDHHRHAGQCACKESFGVTISRLLHGPIAQTASRAEHGVQGHRTPAAATKNRAVNALDLATTISNLLISLGASNIRLPFGETSLRVAWTEPALFYANCRNAKMKKGTREGWMPPPRTFGGLGRKRHQLKASLTARQAIVSASAAQTQSSR